MIQFVKNYILDHWRGNHSLVRSILINTLFVKAIYYVAYKYFEPQMVDEASNLKLIAILSVSIIISTTLITWQSIGIWRSANRSISNHGFTIGHRLIKAYVILFASWSAFQLFDLSLVNFRLIEME